MSNVANLLNTMEDKTAKAFDFAQDTTKQLITLSTAIIAITITFSNDFVSGTPSGLEIGLIVASWVLYLLSIIFGIGTLMALTGTLEPKAEDDCDTSIRGENVTTPSLLQIGSFVLATLVVIIYGAMQFFN